jgi:hypothetical protein
MKATTHKHLLLAAMIFIAALAQAQQPVYLYGKETIGLNPTLLSCDLVIGPFGELYFGSSLPHLQEINTLFIVGNYRGEVGSRIYLSVLDNSNKDGTHGFFDIVGTAGGNTEIILDMFDNWNGSTIYIARAHHLGSDSTAFTMQDSFFNGRLAKLKTDIVGEDRIWFIEGHWTEEECLPLIMQKRNNTLVVNNNEASNGGYNFTHYKWYRNNDELIHEGTVGAGLGGIYNTGKVNLDPHDAYHVVVIDQFGNEHHSCVYNPTIFDHVTKIIAYPNPAPINNSLVAVDVETDDEKILEHGIITVYNTLGQRIGEGVPTNGHRITQVQLPSVKGMYLLKFVSEDVEKTVRIVVQ